MSDEFGFRKHLMNLKPRYGLTPGSYSDDISLDNDAIWLGQMGNFDLWAQPEGETAQGETIYAFVARGKQLEIAEYPFDLHEALAYWRRTVASNQCQYERDQADLMIECYERLQLVRQDIAHQPTLLEAYGEGAATMQQLLDAIARMHKGDLN